MQVIQRSKTEKAPLGPFLDLDLMILIFVVDILWLQLS